MNIEEYFQLNELPFRIGPDARFLYLSDQVKEALAKCEYMARERIGPIYIYGPIGSGKTSILRRLYDQLQQDERYTIAYVISANIKTSNAFLRIIMGEFEVKTELAYDKSLKNFQAFLAECYQHDRVPLLLVDEAQNMSRDTLKLIHYLLNFETATTKLLQIVLVGQEELATKILRYRELASRMYPISMNQMSVDELRQMIKFRWMVAGGQIVPITEDDDAYRVLFAYSKGLPRDAIKVCDELLRVLVARGSRTASAYDVESVARSLNLRI